MIKEFKIGDAVAFTCKMRLKDTTTYLSMTGGTVLFTLKYDINDLDINAAVSKSVAGTGTSTVVQLVHADTVNLIKGNAICDFRYIDANNNPVTSDRQPVIIKDTVTQRVG